MAWVYGCNSNGVKANNYVNSAVRMVLLNCLAGIDHLILVTKKSTAAFTFGTK